MRMVEIPGGTALLREKKDLRGRDSDLLEAAYTAALPVIRKLNAGRPTQKEGESDEEFAQRAMGNSEPLTFDETQSLQVLYRASVVALLSSWDIDEPIPRTVDALADLPGDLYTGMLRAVGASAIAMLLPTDFSAQTADKGDPETGRPPKPPDMAEEERLASPTGNSESSSEPSAASSETESSSPAISPNGSESTTIDASTT